MKKMLIMFLVGLMIFASVGSAFAVEPTDNQVEAAERKAMREERKTARLEMLKALQDEIHQINGLKIGRLDIRAQVIEKQDMILDLYITAKENDNIEGLEAAKEVKEQLKGLNGEIRALHEQIKIQRQSLKEAKKSGDIDQGEILANEIISLGQEVDSKMRSKVDLLQGIIDILS